MFFKKVDVLVQTHSVGDPGSLFAMVLSRDTQGMVHSGGIRHGYQVQHWSQNSGREEDSGTNGIETAVIRWTPSLRRNILFWVLGQDYSKQVWFFGQNKYHGNNCISWGEELRNRLGNLELYLEILIQSHLVCILAEEDNTNYLFTLTGCMQNFILWVSPKSLKAFQNHEFEWLTCSIFFICKMELIIPTLLCQMVVRVK